MLEIINILLISVIQVISCTYVVGYLSKEKLIFNAKNILILVIMEILIFLLLIFDVGIYKPIIFFVVIICGYKNIYGLTPNEAFIINFISMLLHLLGEAVMPSILMNIRIPENIIKQYFQMTPLSGLIIFAFIYLMLCIFGKWLIKFKNLAKKDKITNIIYMLISIALIILFWRNLSNWRNVNVKNFLENIFVISLFIATIFLLFKGRYDVYKTNNKFDELFEQSESVKTLLNRYKKHNHENKNQLIVIRENSKGNDKVIEYIDSILNENVGHEDKWISELSYITDPGISGFLSVKINQMIDNGINVSLTISSKVKNFNFKNIKAKEYKEICRVIGVYLDNAYEASKETEKKEVTIELLLDDKKLLLIISNSYKGKIELDKIDNEGYTTKGKEHGVGLSIVKDIINSNKNLGQKREIIKDYYYQYLYIGN